MRRGPCICIAWLAALALVLPSAATAATPVSQTFTTPGEQPFVVPGGVTTVQVVLVGGSGASGWAETPGGIGATVTATLAVSPGETLYGEVAGNGVPLQSSHEDMGGYGGGADGGYRQTLGDVQGGGGGGGASDVRRCSASAPPAGCGPPASLASRLLVAGGGGGGGGNGEDPPSTAGGNGGSADQSGSKGAHDADIEEGGSGGARATAAAGGAAGGPSAACEPISGSGCPAAGQSGEGGAGGYGIGGGGGGGGGGIFGGGGGGGGAGTAEVVADQFIIRSGGGGGGGGGSSGVPAGAVGVSGFTLVPTATEAQPSVTFTWTPAAPAAVTAPPSAVTATTAALTGTVNPDDWLVSSCAFALSPAPAGVATFPCAQQLGAGATPLPVSATAAGLTPETTYTATLLATSVQGTGSGNPVTFTTEPMPQCACGPPSAPLVVSALKLSRTRFFRGSRAAKLASHAGPASHATMASHAGPPSHATAHSSHKRAHHFKQAAPPGTTISFDLSQPATVTLTFQRAEQGQQAGHSCLAPSPRRRHPRRCTRYTPSPGAIVLQAHAGSDGIHFEGALDGGRLLAPGTYRLTLAAGNATGNTTTAQHPAFTLLG